jgi:hypothetical protein
MHKRYETWHWLILDEVTGRLRVSRHRLTADDAETLHPGAVQMPGSMEYAFLEMTKDAELSVSLNVWWSARVLIPGSHATALAVNCELAT